MSFFVFLFVFLSQGRERTTGTIERVLATPIKKVKLFWLLNWIWYFCYNSDFNYCTFSIYLLNINLANSLAYVILINILLAIALVWEFSFRPLQIQNFK